MGAFDSPFSDIDKTKEGHVYVVDSEGWGWFALFVIAALPLFILWLFLNRYAQFVCQHPIAAAGIYGTAAVAVGAFMYWSRRKKFRLIGVAAAALACLPLAASQVIYAIPYVLMSGDHFFSASVEWILVTGVALGVTVFVQAIGNLAENGLIHFVITLIFTAAALFLLAPPDGMSWETLWSLYRQ